MYPCCEDISLRMRQLAAPGKKTADLLLLVVAITNLDILRNKSGNTAHNPTAN